VIGTFVAFGQQLIAVWVGPGFGRAWIPLLLLSGGLAFNAPLRFAVIWAIAGDRHGRIARLAIIEAVVNIALTIALVNPFGIRGVAAASLATFAVWNGCLVPRRVFPELGLDWVSDFIRPIAVAALITIPLAAGVRAVVVSASASSVVIVVCAAAWSALELAALWRILLRRTERVALRRALGPAFVRR
jgi:hypothetical protein